MKSLSKIFLGVALAVCFGFAGCGGTEEGGGGTTTPPANENAGDNADDNAAVDSAAGGEMVLVSLKLPKMT